MSIEGPRFLEPEEYESMLKLQELCFPGNLPDGAARCWPHIFSDIEECCRNTIVFSEDGHIICAVIICPAAMFVSGTQILAAGISGVAVNPDYRGRGFMRKALELACNEMKQRGIALSWLIGDRQRYNHFGWENAGRKYFFTLTKRSFKAYKNQQYDILQYKGEKHIQEGITALYNQKGLRLERDEKLTETLLGRARKKTFIALKHNVPVSYLVLQQGSDHLNEALAFEHGGDAEGLENILKYCFENLCINQLTVTSPMGMDPCRQILFKNASAWKLDPGYIEFPSLSHMLKILNLKAVLSGFQAQMNEKWILSGCKFRENITLMIKGSIDQATLCFGDNVSISDVCGEKSIVLSEHEMVRLLFGISKPSESFDIPPVLDSVFPLDFFISPLEDV